MEKSGAMMYESLTFRKRHLKSKTHLYGVQKLRNKNPSSPNREILKLISETPEERKRKRECMEKLIIYLTTFYWL